MSNPVDIREEESRDIDPISEIILAAFKGDPHSHQNEHQLVKALRQDQALELSLVAVVKGAVVGHIAFSKILINGKELMWFGLAPVSVDPDFQNQGIGSALVNRGLEIIEKRGGKGCVVLGEPTYYNRFGFYAIDGLTLQDVPAEYFMARSFAGNLPTGTVKYHRAFDDV